MPTIFISYRRSDSQDITGRIHDHLTREYGRESVFIDVDNIPPGVDFQDHINRVVTNCDVLLPIIGPAWSAVCDEQGRRRLDQPDDFVRLEIENALRSDIRVIPVLVGGTQMPSRDSLPESLQALTTINAAEVRSGRDFVHDLEHLVNGINRILGPSKSNSSGTSGESPRTLETGAVSPANAVESRTALDSSLADRGPHVVPDFSTAGHAERHEQGQPADNAERFQCQFHRNSGNVFDYCYEILRTMCWLLVVWTAISLIPLYFIAGLELGLYISIGSGVLYALLHAPFLYSTKLTIHYTDEDELLHELHLAVTELGYVTSKSEKGFVSYRPTLKGGRGTVSLHYKNHVATLLGPYFHLRKIHKLLHCDM